MDFIREWTRKRDMDIRFFQCGSERKACSQQPARAFQLAVDKAFSHLYTQTLEETEAIEQFYSDFKRTTEIILKVAGEEQERVHYIQERDIGLAEEKSKQFLKELELISFSLKTAMIARLHQNGVFYSGGFAMQVFMLLARGLGKQESKHKFIVEVMDENQVIIKEIIEYTALKLISLEEIRKAFFSETADLEFRELTKKEEKVLDKQRQRCLAALRQSDVSEYKKCLLKDETKVLQDSGYFSSISSETEQLPLDEPIIVNLKEPLIATVQYELKYCPQQGSYQLIKLSEDNINIPSTPIEKLLFATEADNDVQEKLKNFFEKVIEIIKTAILAIASQFCHSGESCVKSNCAIIQPRF